MTSEWSLNNILIAYLKKTEAAQTNFFTAQTSTNGAQTKKIILGKFGACGGLVTSSPIIQCVIFKKPKQHKRNFYLHKPAQTIETVLGEFGVCGGLSDLIKRHLNIILIS